MVGQVVASWKCGQVAVAEWSDEVLALLPLVYVEVVLLETQVQARVERFLPQHFWHGLAGGIPVRPERMGAQSELGEHLLPGRHCAPLFGILPFVLASGATIAFLHFGKVRRNALATSRAEPSA